MGETSDSIVDERKELIASFSGNGTPVFRTAHFLKPSVTSIDEPLELLSVSRSSMPPKFEPREWALKINLNGWRNPTKDWTNWVNFMHSKYQAKWKEAGIYEAIMNSTFELHKDEKLVLGIAERWSPGTKTFHFPWGEATITLEDVMVLGGYSVLGDSVLSPLKTTQLKEIHEKLNQARFQISKSRSNKASQSLWMKMFMGSGSEIEHEAFLVTWLSMFVFANTVTKLINKLVFPIAIHLARGKRIALAPAVLATIYKDLNLFKEALVYSPKSNRCNNGSFSLELNLWSPLQLIHLWALERFKALQPKPNFIKRGEPFFARWHKVKGLKLGDVRLALDSSGESFQWRPYTKKVVYWNGCKLFGEKAMWVPVGPQLDEQQELLARCLRVSKLVGIDCIEQYLPHRVSMQFGMDQDLPGSVSQSIETPEVAWTNFSKPIGGTKLYIPSQHFEAGVTVRYLDWKKNFQDETKEGKKPRRSSTEKNMEMVKVLHKASKGEINGGNNDDFPPGFPSKSKTANKSGKSLHVKPELVEMMSSNNMPCSLGKRPVCDGKNLGHSRSLSSSIADNKSSGDSIDKGSGDSNENVQPAFPPTGKTADRAGKSLKIEPAFVEMMNSDNDGKNSGHRPSFSDSIAHTRASGEKKLLSESVERIRQSEGSMEGLKITRNDVNGRNSGNLDSCTVSNYNSNSERNRQEHLEFEARISRLERAVAMMRAAMPGKSRLV
ncbi:hypothetical protein FEM48_Zijuj01G0227600 [Ziziphus jujuba var. spinosa]|uniref:Aminotransferase-like plant mobile domain-containing protein n=1 Tax=Ziziphus jujuba var. spinosa TaxID=714518 RepID=A0A978W3Z9_ZIZJJ|nr:hypothetical protein FEM48_Zijuj01G0227600 [Ziziphus jujuba var. spinosa]